MIMMVMSKKKLKKIIFTILAIVIAICTSVYVYNKINQKPAFEMIDQAKIPYTQGTKESSGYVALTCNVDLGWESEYVESILDTLEKEKVNITFNVTGKWAEKNEDLLLKIKSKGHEIGNHGYEHLDYEKLTYEQNYEQIEKSKKIIEEKINEETKFFQAPAGAFGEPTIKAASELGYISFKWDIDTIDWKYRDQPDVIINRVKNKEIVDGSIILMHPTNATTQCIADIIKIIRQEGFEAGRLSDVFVVE